MMSFAGNMYHVTVLECDWKRTAIQQNFGLQNLTLPNKSFLAADF